MKISAITQQKRNPENVNIFLDKKYWISLSKNQLIELGIHKGMEIDEAEKKSLEQDSLFNKLYQKSLNYISIRPRSIKEISTYLWKNEAPKQMSEKIIDKLINLKLLNDYEFAKWYASGKKDSLKLHGPKKIEAKLFEKGIDSKIIKQVFEELSIYDLSNEKQEKILDLIKKEKLKLKDKEENEYKIKQKIIQKLLRKGYLYAQVKDLV